MPRSTSGSNAARQAAPSGLIHHPAVENVDWSVAPLHPLLSRSHTDLGMTSASHAIQGSRAEQGGDLVHQTRLVVFGTEQVRDLMRDRVSGP